MANSVPNYTETEPEERIAVRSRLLEEMSPALRKWVENIETKLSDRSTGELKFYWTIGRDAHSLTENSSKYGDNPIEKASFCLGRDKEILWKAIRFYKAFDKDTDLTMLTAIRVKGTNRSLTWSHIVVTLPVTEKEQRFNLLRQAAENGWNHTELDREVAKVLNKSERHAGGRNPAKPKTIDAMIQNAQLKLLPVKKTLAEVYNNESHGFLAVVNASNPNSYTPDMIKEMEQLEAASAEMAEQLEQFKQQVTIAKKRVQHGLAQKSKDEAEKTTSKLTDKQKVNI